VARNSLHYGQVQVSTPRNADANFAGFEVRNVPLRHWKCLKVGKARRELRLAVGVACSARDMASFLLHRVSLAGRKHKHDEMRSHGKIQVERNVSHNSLKPEFHIKQQNLSIKV
jgi:hypothetical protein